jgi:TonB family protein
VLLPRNCKISHMSQLKYAIAAAVLTSALWTQSPAPPAVNTGVPAPPASQSQSPDASTPPVSNPSSAPTAPTTPPPTPDSTKLVVTKLVKPAYPPAAVPDKLQGQVIVRIVVDENGDVESAEVISGNPLLANAAVDAAKQWKFKPYIRNGQPVKAAVKLPFDFAPPADGAPPATQTIILTAPTAPAHVAPPTRIRVSSGVMHGLLIHKVVPSYPSQALQVHLQGTVVLKAVISKEGTIEALQVISGDPLLTRAAIDAVKQWRYRPYILNGEPVEVDTTVEVGFWLQD